MTITGTDGATLIVALLTLTTIAAIAAWGEHRDNNRKDD